MDNEAAFSPPHLRDGAEEGASIISEAPGVEPMRESLAVDDEIKALRAERDALKAEQQDAVLAATANLVEEQARRSEVAALRRQVAELLRLRKGSAGATPAPRNRVLGLEQSTRLDTPVGSVLRAADSASQVGSYAYDADDSHPRAHFRNPTPYKGENLKEATIFLRSLATIFKIDPRSFATDQKRVLYAVTWLTDKPQEDWMVHGDDDMAWDEFESFIMNCVADPVNRSLDVGQSYEDARQKEGESVNSFAMHLSTLESQFHDSYTEAQRTRHLFNKLRNNIREQISLKADVPNNRRDLIAMASRLENAQKPRSQHRAVTGDRPPRDGGAAGKKRKGPGKDSPSQAHGRPNDKGSGGSAPKPFNAGDQRKIYCYNCGQEGHKSHDCRNPRKESATQATRKVGTTDPNGSSMGRPRKSAKKGRGQTAAARFSLT
jgi:hypothetical protein